MIALSHNARAVLDEMRKAAEGAVTVDGKRRWRLVEFNRVDTCGLSPRVFAWTVSSLTHAELYRPCVGVDGFGIVCTGGEGVPT